MALLFKASVYIQRQAAYIKYVYHNPPCVIFGLKMETYRQRLRKHLLTALVHYHNRRLYWMVLALKKIIYPQRRMKTRPQP